MFEELPSAASVAGVAAKTYVEDADYDDLAAWYSTLMRANDRTQSVTIRPTQCGDDDGLTDAEVAKLRGVMIIVEGGVGQGKTTLARAIAKYAQRVGVSCDVEYEPVDARSLELFMKYGAADVNAIADPEAKEVATAARKAAAVRMQFTMLQARSENLRSATVRAAQGHLAIVDRGPFGDCAFMTTTFSEFGVPVDLWLRYMVLFQRLYVETGFPPGKLVFVRMAAPPAVAHARWLRREGNVGGNKYDIEYVRKIERAHDICERGWGRCVIYDNSDVPITSRNEPSTAAVAAVLRAAAALCT